MPRPKGSKNKKKQVEVVNTNTELEVKKPKRSKEEEKNSEDPVSVLIFDFESLTAHSTKRGGVGIKNKKTEFAILADSSSRLLELKFNLMGGNLQTMKEETFNVSITPEAVKSILDYVRNTSSSKIDKHFKKLQSEVMKSDKNAD